MCYSLTVVWLSPFSEGDFYLEFNFELPDDAPVNDPRVDLIVRRP